MDALPLELHEQIFDYLVPAYDLKQIVTLPTYTKEQRRDIHNLRLTNRRLRNSSTLHFTRIVQDVPTGCTYKSMQKLASLVSTPGIGERMTCLSLNDFAQALIQRERGDDEWDFRVVPEWIRESLPATLRQVLSSLPHARHLVCIMDPPDEDARYEWRQNYSEWHMCILESSEESEEESAKWLHKLSSALKIIQDAIFDALPEQPLSSIALLRPPTGNWGGNTPWPENSISSHAHLEHFTFAACTQLRYMEIGRLPKLRTLHFVACESESTPNWYHYWRHFNLATSDNLQEVIISGGVYQLTCRPEDIMFAFCRPQLRRFLKRLTFKDIIMNVDIGWQLPDRFTEDTGDFSTEALVCDNFQYTLSDEITLSGPSEPKDIGEKFKPFKVISAKSHNVKVIKANGELVWYKKEGSIQSASQDT